MDDALGRVYRLEGPARAPLVDVEDVTKRYAGREAVTSLALSLRPGEVLGLVGGNGGGKTTTLRILGGLLKPDEGRGRVLGFDLLGGAREIRRRVGYMSQRLSLYSELTVFENLRFRAEVYGLSGSRMAAEATMRDFDLTRYGRTPAGALSGGWARRLQLAAALIHSPRLVLLDEPTAGLDVGSRQEAWHRIERTARAGSGVIVSTHDLSEAEWCSRAALLSEGRIVAMGTPEQVARSVPASVFLLSGSHVRRLAHALRRVPGVIATYPQGVNLRVVAAVGAESALESIARSSATRLARVGMCLEDAALVLGQTASKGWG
jgi:ABC-2 type transport system ATP-binding protein